MALTLGFHNLDWSRSRRARAIDLHDLTSARARKPSSGFQTTTFGPAVDVWGFVELREWLTTFVSRLAYLALQLELRGGGPQSEAIAVAVGRRVVASGSKLAFLHRLGHAIGWRRLVWVTVDDDQLGEVTVVYVHAPPKRMWGPLYDTVMRRLRRLIRRHHRLGRSVAVLGDLNHEIPGQDPGRLRATFGGRWYGKRIDGCWVDDELAPHVVSYTEDVPPGRADRHAIVKIHLSGDQ